MTKCPKCGRYAAVEEGEYELTCLSVSCDYRGAKRKTLEERVEIIEKEIKQMKEASLSSLRRTARDARKRWTELGCSKPSEEEKRNTLSRNLLLIELEKK